MLPEWLSNRTVLIAAAGGLAAALLLVVIIALSSLGAEPETPPVPTRYAWSGFDDLVVPNERYRDLIPEELPYAVIGTRFRVSDPLEPPLDQIAPDNVQETIEEEIARLLNSVP